MLTTPFAKTIDMKVRECKLSRYERIDKDTSHYIKEQVAQGKKRMQLAIELGLAYTTVVYHARVREPKPSRTPPAE